VDVGREVKYCLIDGVNYGANVDLAFHGCPRIALVLPVFRFAGWVSGTGPKCPIQTKEIDCHASEGPRLVRAASRFALSSPCDLRGSCFGSLWERVCGEGPQELQRAIKDASRETPEQSIP